jgi:hypothetical protein
MNSGAQAGPDLIAGSITLCCSYLARACCAPNALASLNPAARKGAVGPVAALSHS